MPDDLNDFRLPSALDLAVYPLAEVQPSCDELPAPSLVAQAAIPEPVSRERTDGVGRPPHEAARRMRVHCHEEGHEEVMCVPEGLEGL